MHEIHVCYQTKIKGAKRATGNAYVRIDICNLGDDVSIHDRQKVGIIIRIQRYEKVEKLARCMVYK